ncbi:hypothetical protein B296_00029393, partial [Ensete ventricosum]
DLPLPSNADERQLKATHDRCGTVGHVIAFRAQMDLYDTSGTLMCRAFPIALSDSAQSLVERLATIVLAMLQRSNQYVVTESLVVGRDEESHKRLCTEQPRDLSSRPPWRRLDKPETLLSRPPLPPLNSSEA